MTRLAVVAYPTLADADRAWIAGVRARYDPMAPRIAAHFTLVFPRTAADASFVAEARRALGVSRAFAVVLRRAAAYPDAIGQGHYVFLLAEEGRRGLRALHDALSAAVVPASGRAEIQFVPHITVGAHPERAECARIAEQLNQEGRIVRGSIDSVCVVRVGETTVQTIAEIPLAGARGTRRRHEPSFEAPTDPAS